MATRQHENGGTPTLHKRLRTIALNTVSPNARAKRMEHFETVMAPRPGSRILDLGGTTKLWQHVKTPLKISVLNLEVQRIHEEKYGQHEFSILRGDATNVEYEDNAFDLVFSNSVIEHVGGAENERAFAREVRRLAPAYYIQTPARSFPVEAHTALPWWWYYPEPLRRKITNKWRTLRPAYADFIDNTVVVTLPELKKMFPDAQVARERMMGFVKSYTMYRKGA